MLDSANGPVRADRVVALQIEALYDNIEPYLLDDSPDVLTIGRRCQDQGFDFRWRC